MSGGASLGDLRETIERHLESTGIYQKIQSFVDEYIAQNEKNATNDTTDDAENMLRVFRSRGVLDSLIRSLSKSAGVAEAPPERGRFLWLSIPRGRGFVEQIAADKGDSLIVDVCLLGQRLRSRAVPAGPDPTFEADFVIDINSACNVDSFTTVSMYSLLSNRSEYGSIVVIKRSAAEDRAVGQQRFEWRAVLANGRASLRLGVLPCGASGAGSSATPIGILEARIEVLPSAGEQVSEAEIDEKIAADDQLEKEREVSFLQYARAWYDDLCAEANTGGMSSGQRRPMKMFSNDEQGKRCFVCEYIVPVSSEDALGSPQLACRYVAALQVHRAELVGGERAGTWQHPHTSIAAGGGDVEDHATLLCSLLLPYGLDAYVVLGRAAADSETWVVVLRRDETGVTAATFIDPLSGKRFRQKAERAKYPYTQVHAIFNHASYYACLAPTAHPAEISFDVTDGTSWKAMDRRRITALVASKRTRQSLSLRPSHVSPATCAEIQQSIDRALGEFLVREREKAGLRSVFAPELRPVLATALASFEHRRAIDPGMVVTEDDFTSGILHFVPEGETFKGYPAVFTSTSHASIVESLRKAQALMEIVLTPERSVRFVYKSRAVPLAEDVTVVWVMIAAVLPAVK